MSDFIRSVILSSSCVSAGMVFGVALAYRQLRKRDGARALQDAIARTEWRGSNVRKYHNLQNLVQALVSDAEVLDHLVQTAAGNSRKDENVVANEFHLRSQQVLLSAEAILNILRDWRPGWAGASSSYEVGSEGNGAADGEDPVDR